MLFERRKDRRRGYSLRGHFARLKQTNRLKQLGMATVATAVIAGVTLARCNSPGITGPDAGTGKPPAGVSTSDGVVDLDVIPNLPAVKIEDDPDVVKSNPDFTTSTRTTFPVTEVVHNPCRNEDPLLNGYATHYEKITLDQLSLKYKFQIWKDTRGVAATVFATYDHDRDPLTPPRTGTVKYRNADRYLDRFEVGPAGLPFESLVEQRIHLERLSPEHGYKYGRDWGKSDGDDDDREYRKGIGDDLFVYTKQRIRVNKDGAQKEETVFRTECR